MDLVGSPARIAELDGFEPGDRIDVIGVFRDPKTREMVSVTMLQNVIVLATGRIGGQTNLRLLSENDRAFNTVTVHVLQGEREMASANKSLARFDLAGIAPAPRFLFPSPDANCTGASCNPPPLGCIGVECFDPGFVNNPVRTLWTQDGIE